MTPNMDWLDAHPVHRLDTETRRCTCGEYVCPTCLRCPDKCQCALVRAGEEWRERTYGNT